MCLPRECSSTHHRHDVWHHPHYEVAALGQEDLHGTHSGEQAGGAAAALTTGWVVRTLHGDPRQDATIKDDVPSRRRCYQKAEGRCLIREPFRSDIALVQVRNQPRHSRNNYNTTIRIIVDIN
jgi:hypothetical protein